MKFKVSVPDFQYAMRLVRDVVPSSGPLAESVGVLISVEGNTAVFTAFNPEVMAKATVKVEASREGEVVVDAAALYNAISHFQPRKDSGVGTSDIVVISSPKSRKLNVSATTRYASGSETPHKRVFPLRNQEFFPVVPSPDVVDQTFEFPASILMDAIDSVSYAVSADKNQLIFTGVLFQLEDGRLSMFATNGVCLAEYSAKVPYSGDPLRVVIPGSFAAKISKSFFDNDVLTVSLTRSMMFVQTPNLVLGGTLIREEYPDYTSVFPESTTSVLLDKHILLDNLVNLSYEASSLDDNRVTMCLSGGEASLVCGGSTNGGLVAEFGGDFTFACDLKLFAGSIKNIAGDTLKIGFTDASCPLRFSSGDEDASGLGLTCVLVPLSVQ